MERVEKNPQLPTNKSNTNHQPRSTTASVECIRELADSKQIPIRKTSELVLVLAHFLSNREELYIPIVLDGNEQGKVMIKSSKNRPYTL